MALDIRVPPLGESLVEATVGQWLKHAGDAVKAGEPLVELETEKVNLEVSAGASGVLERIDKGPGSNVHVGEILGSIATEAIAVLKSAPAPAQAAPASPPEAPDVGPRHPISPVARQIAAEHGIDLAAISGSGPGGRIRQADVSRYLEEHQPPVAESVAPPEPAVVTPAIAAPVVAARAESRGPIESAPLPTETRGPARPEERVRMSRRRLTIARRLVDAQRETASLTTFNEIDMTAVMDLRRRRKEAFQTRHGIGLGFMSFFVKASVAALKAFPNVNAEMQDDDLILKRYYDLGIAVDTEGGLVVPVVRNVDQKSFPEIERGIADLAGRVRDNKLSIDELRGGTFTITNGGIFGSLFSTPIINPPQVAILGMHRIVERPIAVQGQVAIHPMMYVALTYDHRVIDGRTAVQFLIRIKDLLEDPETLLLDG